MMVNKLTAFFFLIHTFVFSQSSIGFIDNYSGVQSVMYNPASILDTAYKVDVNVFSASMDVSNDYYYIDPFKIIEDLSILTKPHIKDLSKNFYKSFDKYLIKYNVSESNNAYVNATILGPSFLWTIDRYNAVAFTTSVRTYGNAYGFSSKLYDDITNNSYLLTPYKYFTENPENISKDLSVSTSNFSQVFSWAEVGLSYSGLVKQTSKDMLKFGISLKLLKGLYAGGVFTDNFTAKLDFDSTDPVNSSANLTGVVTSFTNTDLENFSLDTAANFGIGIDFGVVYEKRSITLPINLKDKNGVVYFSKAPYRYKIGLSLTDLGYINFNNVYTENKHLDLTFPGDTFELEDYLYVDDKSAIDPVSYLLPTTARLNIDYNFNSKIYLNANFDIHTFPTNKKGVIKYVSNYLISPRFESRKFSISFPMTIDGFGLFKAGFGIRTGYFFMGSSSFFTNMTNNSNSGNIFMGLKIPVYNKKVINEFKDSLRHIKTSRR